MDSYKNILANKFMRDTNYIIIKDTDDLEELERQFELFNSQLTVRQQRLSDDRSIEIWNMTNQQHYESLKTELMKKIDSQFNDDIEDNVILYDPDNDGEIEDDVTNMLNNDYDEDIATAVKEESIPINKSQQDITIDFACSRDEEKDNQAVQYEIDTNMHIIGKIDGDDVNEYLQNLEKSFTEFNAQPHDHRKKSDDKCREIYGLSNLERYNMLKANALNNMSVNDSHEVKSTDTSTLDIDIETKLEFVNRVKQNLQYVNEIEQMKVNKHRRFNDTPYFTPSELIDMGVHGNHNFYSKDADNDGLIKSGVKAVTWFDNYNDMCMDHIFEDYTKDWIDTLDILYSDFEDIKLSGDEEKILARKQSILDLGWNPEIPFNRKNRLKASKRVNKILDETIPKDIFINLDEIIPDDSIIEEQATKATHKPVLLIFTKGKTPIISQGIKFFTNSEYSHASISFDPMLDKVYSYNIREGFGFIKENLESFKDNVISVMAFFAPNEVVKSLKDKVEDFQNNKTNFDLRIFFNKIIHIDHKYGNNEYNQVCSTFVDTVLKSGGINLVGDVEIPDPGQLYTSAKSVPNKIIEVFNDIATKYNGSKVKRKLNQLLAKGCISINENIYNMKSSERNDSYYNIEQWESNECNLMWITGLSGSGKSTIAKEICSVYGAEHVELDSLQRAKMGNWDTTGSTLLDNYINSKGGLECIFDYVNDLDTVTWKEIVSDERCCRQFNDLYKYIVKYASSHKNKKFVIEGVQIAQCADKSNSKVISSYPVIIKNNGILKTEFRREIRTIKHGIDAKDTFYNIMSKVARRHTSWIKNKFYIDDLQNLKSFKTFIDSSSVLEVKLPDDVTLRPANKNDYDNMYKWGMESISPKLKNDPKVIKFMEDDTTKSIPITKMIMYKNQTIGMLTTDKLSPDSEYWYIGEIYIDKKYRGKGIGTALIKSEIEGHDKIKLQVSQSNKHAIKLYKSLGFKITETNNKDMMYVMTLDKTTVKEDTSIIIEGMLDKIKNYGKYKAPLPSIAYKDGKPLPLTIRKYETKVLPIEIYNKYGNSAFITKEDIWSVTFSPDNLREIQTIPKNKHIYQVAYCNDKYNVILVYEDLDKVQNYLKRINGSTKKQEYNFKNDDITNINIDSKYCYIDKENNENLNGSEFIYPNKNINESVSILNEVKQFPIEFDKEGNLIIYKSRIGSLSFGDEVADSVQLLDSYRNASNIEGIKYELAKLWYINDCIEKKLKKRLSNDQYKELIDTRATCLNVFKSNLDYVIKAEKGFNFSDYYNSTPFSDNSTKISINTLKYAAKTIVSMI